MLKVLALVLVAEQVDAGFEPVVLDVARAELYLRSSDGGVSDAPVKVQGGTWMDDDTTMWLATKKADSRGRLSVGPEVDTKTLTLVGAVMFGIGVVAGGVAVGALVYAWKR